ncbi:major facilitator superfamily transporter [Diaporthe helianthi]|uniref:Major facilitator superfamily transporter n=1 Tax=Diaporthe helianthi TaxID=158607 RepID=A0A2P5HX52_DIAHE|nr:major facilitator superfamily transporter [Diaporthe helianthi]
MHEMIGTRQATAVAQTPAEPRPVNKSQTEKKETVSWRDLPRKQQLVVITLTRLSEPLVQTSLQAYMFYQLKWFDTSLSDSVISSQAGVLHASFTAAQLLTTMMWGRVADSSRFGRKKVIMIGLIGTMISCLGFGFSTSFWQALFFRCLGGVTNGNVGVLRTMISEIVREKKYQSRAFLLLPMTFNIGVIIGPILGGVLADPAASYPDLFGETSFFLNFPYVMPNLVSAFFLLSASITAWLFLEETLDARVDKRDWGIATRKGLGTVLSTCFSRNRLSAGYTQLASREDATTSMAMTSSWTPSPVTPTTPKLSKRARRQPRYTQRLPFRRIFTRNVCITLLARFCLAFHVGTFNSLWFVFLSTPVYDPNKPTDAHPGRHLPFVFTGGLGLPPAKVGTAMAVLGVLGITLQLFVYPALSARLGTVRCLRMALVCFPLAYFLAPFLSLVPSSTEPPTPKSGPAMWIAISGVLLCQVVGRTFAAPNMAILVNNCSPHPSVLGTFHGLAQTCSSAARTLGPVLCGFLYGVGLAHGVVGGVWWGLSLWAVMGWLTSWLLREGDGHEIWLDGDEEDEGIEITKTVQ